MEAFLLGLFFKALRWLFGWVIKGIRPVVTALLRALWPLVRLVLIVAAIVAGIVLMRQFLARNPEFVQRLRARA